jgi:hypothetical protein
MIEALEFDGWTGLADRMARGGQRDLPPRGKIDRRLGFVTESRPQSLAELLGSAAAQNVLPKNRGRR